MAEATVRGLIAQARSQRFKLTHAIEDVDNQVALIRQRVATWEQSKASLVLAQQEFDRAKHLLASKVVSNEEYDQKQAALAVANAQVTQALQNVYQARAALGLPAVPPAGTGGVKALRAGAFRPQRRATFDRVEKIYCRAVAVAHKQ